ncbi:MAG: 4-alpha-glucanotransferase [Puniceicoccales bacterium]|jgi:4-alpha-glucanotransferase|nr:4-alpha-glucanotransferase [Puniceicoccales bacterium]
MATCNQEPPKYLSPRASGILLPISALPGAHGIGDIGPTALRWLEFLHASGQKLWQILPIHPTGYGNSPYQSTSAMAYNPLLISLEQLAYDGFLSRTDLTNYPRTSPDWVEYECLIPVREKLLRKAAENFLKDGRLSGYNRFLGEQPWVENYALFEALDGQFFGHTWSEWPEEFRHREPNALEKVRNDLALELATAKVKQYFFHNQWQWLRQRAQQLSIKIIGDMPIFVAHHSADAWSNPELFDLQQNGSPRVVAGVPPDYFSKTGQRWGNPLYRWEKHAETHYAWWAERLRHAMALYDVVRIDHFRAFADYWEIPAAEETAIHGTWRAGPGLNFFSELQSQLGELPIIAEDLGILSETAVKLRDQVGAPGLRILLFAFDEDDPRSPFLPENYIENCVAYTGTHDNDTAVGTFSEEGTGKMRMNVLKKCLTETCVDFSFPKNLLHWLSRSCARWIIYPMQDVLGLGSHTRTNTPGTPDNNWKWKLKGDELNPELQILLQQLGLRKKAPPNG